jgi:hypothetical protein
MANFPGPTYNRIIETDPQIIKVPLDNLGFGARLSIFGADVMGADPSSNSPQKSGPPKAPEFGLKHTD